MKSKLAILLAGMILCANVFGSGLVISPGEEADDFVSLEESLFEEEQAGQALEENLSGDFEAALETDVMDEGIESDALEAAEEGLFEAEFASTAQDQESFSSQAEFSADDSPFTSGDVLEESLPDAGVAATNTITITNTGESDYYEEIQDALDTAMGSSGTTTVRIEAGTYPISYTLDIYPGTNLILDANTKIVATGSRFDSDYTMLRGNHVGDDGNKCKLEEDCPHGEYSQVHDVFICGGTWDRGSYQTNSSVMNLKHGKNITVRDCTVMHAGYHFLNFTASRDVLVENVTIKDRSTSLNLSEYNPQLETIEAIHLDCASATGKTNPPDGTPCRNITVRGCTFDNVYAGVGNHHPKDKEFGENILVENCTFRNMYGCSLCFYGFKNARGIRNRIYGGYKAVVVKQEAQAYLEGNYIEGASYFGIQVSEGCTADCYSNTITNVGPSQNKISAGMSYEENTNGTLSGNEVKHCYTYGMLLKGKGPFVIKGNTIQDTKVDSGLVLRYGSRATITGNTIQDTKENLIKLDEVGECLVEDNHLSNGQTNGIYVAGSTGTVTVKDNHIYNVYGCGIRVNSFDGFEGTRGYLQGNRIDKAETGIFFVASRGTAYNNTIRNCTKYGIYIYGSREILDIFSNDIQDTSKSAISVGYNNNASLGAMAHIKGNVAVCSSYEPDIRISSGCSNCTVEYNYLGSNGIKSAIAYEGGGNTTYDQRPTPTPTPRPTSTPTPTATPKPTSTPIATLGTTKIKSLTNSSSGKVKVTWNKVANADGYYLQFSSKKSMPESSSTTLTVAGGSKKKCTVKVGSLKTAYFRIRAYKQVSGREILGAWSKVKKIKLKK